MTADALIIAQLKGKECEPETCCL